VTEHERAEAVVHAKQRQWVWNLVGLTALALSIGLAALVAWDGWQRADAAEQTAVSFAQQVQDACADGGLLVDGRDLCPRADEIVEDPAAPPVSQPAADGDDATDAQVAAGVATWFATHDLSLTPGYSTSLQAAVARYLSRNPPPPGKDGEDASQVTDQQIAAAVATYLIAHPPADGTDGTDGRGVVAASLEGCDVVFTFTDGATDRIGPICGAAGHDGSDGVGISKTECLDTGDWIITYTDGTADTEIGPCRGPKGDQGTAKPGTYACPENEFATGFTVAQDGAVTLTCRAMTGPPVIDPSTPPS